MLLEKLFACSGSVDSSRYLKATPAEADMRRFFRVSGPAVPPDGAGLEKAGLISRQTRVPRSIQLLIDPAALPDLLPGYDQSVKTPCRGTSGFLRMKLRNPKQSSRQFRSIPATDSDRSQPPVKGGVAVLGHSSTDGTLSGSNTRGAPCQPRDCRCVRSEKFCV